jgi:hypothetical protein
VAEGTTFIANARVAAVKKGDRLPGQGTALADAEVRHGEAIVQIQRPDGAIDQQVWTDPNTVIKVARAV